MESTISLTDIADVLREVAEGIENKSKEKKEERVTREEGWSLVENLTKDKMFRNVLSFRDKDVYYKTTMEECSCPHWQNRCVHTGEECKHQKRLVREAKRYSNMFYN